MEKLKRNDSKVCLSISADYWISKGSGQEPTLKSEKFIYETEVKDSGEYFTDIDKVRLRTLTRIKEVDTESHQGFKLARIVATKQGRILIDENYD